MARIDLHTHSTESDGTNTIAANVALAAERGLDGIAITDHDTTAGYGEAARAAEEAGIEWIPGIEFSAEHDGASLHVLAYWADPADPPLVDELRKLTDTRFRRGELMVENLRSLGYDISFDRVREIAGDALIARPHIAQAMVEAGIVSTEKEAFDRFISDGGIAYVPKHALAPLDALRLIRDAGGVCVLAHPAMWKGNGAVPDALIEEMAAADPDDSARQFELNRSFHRTLVEPCENGLLLKMLDSLWDHPVNRRITRSYVHDPGNVNLMTQEHREILEAARAADVDRLLKLSEHHMSTGYREAVDAAAVAGAAETAGAARDTSA